MRKRSKRDAPYKKNNEPKPTWGTVFQNLTEISSATHRRVEEFSEIHHVLRLILSTDMAWVMYPDGGFHHHDLVSESWETGFLDFSSVDVFEGDEVADEIPRRTQTSTMMEVEAHLVELERLLGMEQGRQVI